MTFRDLLVVLCCPDAIPIQNATMAYGLAVEIKGPLNGVTVIDLTRALSGPYCTWMLSELGAKVIKIEMPPTGDGNRRVGPFYKGKSMYFQSVNRNKLAIALNLKDDGDRGKLQVRGESLSYVDPTKSDGE